MSTCDECGAIHGPGNTNTLCPLASNFNPQLAASLEQEERLRETPPTYTDDVIEVMRATITALRARVAELEAANERQTTAFEAAMDELQTVREERDQDRAYQAWRGVDS